MGCLHSINNNRKLKNLDITTKHKKFTFDGIVTKARVIDVYDGDTCTIAFFYKNIQIIDSFRMLGYDSPEMKPRKDINNRDLHIKAGIIAKDYLSNLILGKMVWVKFSKEEKFGRCMGEISLKKYSGKSINTIMIEQKYGKQYDGKKKEEFTKNDLLSIINHNLA